MQKSIVSPALTRSDLTCRASGVISAAACRARRCQSRRTHLPRGDSSTSVLRVLSRRQKYPPVLLGSVSGSVSGTWNTWSEVAADGRGREDDRARRRIAFEFEADGAIERDVGGVGNGSPGVDQDCLALGGRHRRQIGGGYLVGGWVHAAGGYAAANAVPLPGHGRDLMDVQRTRTAAPCGTTQQSPRQPRGD